MGFYDLPCEWSLGSCPLEIAIVRDPEREINFYFIVSEQRKGDKQEY